MAENRYKPAAESVHAPVLGAGKAAVAATASLVPFAGTFGLEIFNQTRNAIDRERMERFDNQIGQAITNLEVWRERLEESEALKSTFIEAGEIATKTHDEAKLRALKNAVLNVFSRPSMDEYKRTVFMDLLGRYSSFHLKILYIYDVPEAVLNSGYVRTLLSEFESDDACIDIPVSDIAREVFDLPSQAVARVGNQLLDMDHLIRGDGEIRVRPRKSSLTDLGKEFLEFIQDPESLNIS